MMIMISFWYRPPFCLPLPASLVRILSHHDITSSRSAGRQRWSQMMLDISEDAHTFTHEPSRTSPLFLHQIKWSVYRSSRCVSVCYVCVLRSCARICNIFLRGHGQCLIRRVSERSCHSPTCCQGGLGLNPLSDIYYDIGRYHHGGCCYWCRGTQRQRRGAALPSGRVSERAGLFQQPECGAGRLSTGCENQEPRVCEASLLLHRPDHDGHPAEPEEAPHPQRDLRLHQPPLRVLPGEVSGLAEFDPAQPVAQWLFR